MNQPILCDPNSNPLPVDYDPNTIEQCDECDCDCAACELTDTIAGFLCRECKARFMGAAHGLLTTCTRYAQRKAGL